VDFDGGVELRLTSVTKQNAVDSILADTGPEALVAYAGDDATDEDAFRALPETGLRVLVRPDWRETAADVWLTPPDDLLSFLDRWIKATAP